MAARELRRPVKVVLTRTEMYSGHGYRPHPIQKVALGAERSGKLRAMTHEVLHNTSSSEDFSDDTTRFTRSVYACPNYYAPLRVTATDLNTPTWMRPPGAVSGMFALESAMDELAYELKMDPLELRLVNYAEVDPDTGKPWEQGAQGVLPAGGGEVRVEGLQVRAPINARWKVAGGRGEWPPASGELTRCPRQRRSRCAATGRRTSPARPATLVRGPTRR